jgi:hypothetical protein
MARTKTQSRPQTIAQAHGKGTGNAAMRAQVKTKTGRSRRSPVPKSAAAALAGGWLSASGEHALEVSFYFKIRTKSCTKLTTSGGSTRDPPHTTQVGENLYHTKGAHYTDYTRDPRISRLRYLSSNGRHD